MHLARLAALVLVPLATCSGPPTIEGVPGHVDYVAVGDSFSAGGWIDDSSTDSLGCVRSSNNYPALLASRLQVTSFTDRTCGGASSLDLTGDRGRADESGLQPQLEAVSQETDLVTVGIGVNDFGLYAEIVGCLGARPASRCADGAGGSLVQSATRVRARLVDALTRTRDAAPGARVLLIGYPRLLPGAHGCADLPVEQETATWVHQAEQQLDRSMRSAARQARVEYLSLLGPSEGHDVCSGERAWVNGSHPEGGDGAPFHPNLRGMRAVAGEIYRTLTRERPPQE